MRNNCFLNKLNGSMSKF